MVLDTSGVTLTRTLDILNIFWKNREYYLSLHTIKFYCVYSKIFFFLSHFLVVEDYDLSQSSSHLLLSVPLTLEYVRIGSSLFFCTFCVRFPSNLMILLSTQLSPVVASQDSLWVELSSRTSLRKVVLKIWNSLESNRGFY